MQSQGVQVVLGSTLQGGQMSGWTVQNHRWVRCSDVNVVAVYDRYPSQTRPEDFQEALEQLHGVPLCNPPKVTSLCRDKLLCQRFLEESGVELPSVEGDPALFVERGKQWQHCFLKPRFGSFGMGIQMVTARDWQNRADRIVEAIAGQDWIIQAGVCPPSDWAGVSLRALCQRDGFRTWQVLPVVVRRHRSDPVVNAARGAELVAADHVLGQTTREQVEAISLQVCHALSTLPEGDAIVELGIDLVVDADDAPHVIEVNSRPRGRLAALADQWPDRFACSHRDAIVRPLMSLAEWYG